MKNILIIGAVLFGLFFISQKGKQEGADLNRIKADLAHNLVYTSQNDVDPIPNPDDKIPDLKDCPICHGTRIQVHGDGHKTPCPYHGNQEVEIPKIELPLVTIPPPSRPKVIAKATHCPCGCNHNVSNCNCRATCPGKKLPAYTYVTVKKPVITTKSYSSSGGRWVCNGRSCVWVSNQPNAQIDKDHQVIQQTQSVMKNYSYSNNTNRINRFGNQRVFQGRARRFGRGILDRIIFWK